MRRRPALLQGPQRDRRARGAATGGAPARATCRSPRRRSAAAAAALKRTPARRHAGGAGLAGRLARGPAGGASRWRARRSASREVYVGGRPDGWKDDFLKRADENPNRQRAGAGRRRPSASRSGRSPSSPAAIDGGRGEGGLGGRRRAAGRRGGGRDAGRPRRAASCQAINDGAARRRGRPCCSRPRRTPSATAPSSTSRGARSAFERAYWPARRLAAALGPGRASSAAALGMTPRFAHARERLAALGAAGCAGAAPASSGTRLPPIGTPASGLAPLAAGTVDGRLPGLPRARPSRPRRATRAGS